MTTFARTVEALDAFEPRCISGTVDSVRGMTVLVRRLRVPIGSIVRIEGATRQRESVLGEVIGFSDSRAIVMLLAGSSGTGPGDRVHLERVSDAIMVGDSWLGRVLDGLGRPIDGGPLPSRGSRRGRCSSPVVNPMTRGLVKEPLATGVRAIDGLTTDRKGAADRNLRRPRGREEHHDGFDRSWHLWRTSTSSPWSGERGREVKEFIVDALGQ